MRSLGRHTQINLNDLRVPVFCFLFFALAWIYWARIWRWPIFANDDLIFLTRIKKPYGQATFTEVGSCLISDVMERNGRSADGIFQLIAAVTTHFNVVFPLLCLLLSISGYLWLQSAYRDLHNEKIPGYMRVAACATSVLFVFVLSFWQPLLPAKTILFMAATVGYLGGLALTLLCLTLLAKQFRDDTYSFARVALLGIFLIFSALFHELVALTIFAYSFLLFLSHLTNKSSSKKLVVTATYGLLMLLRFATPGMWSRRDLANGINSAESLNPILNLFYSLPRVLQTTTGLGAVWICSVIVFAFSPLLHKKSNIARRFTVVVPSIILIFSSLGIGAFSLYWKNTAQLQGGTDKIPVIAAGSKTGFILIALVLLYFLSMFVLSIAVSKVSLQVAGAVLSAHLCLAFLLMGPYVDERTMFIPNSLMLLALIATFFYCVSNVMGSSVNLGDGSVSDMASNCENSTSVLSRNAIRKICMIVAIALSGLVLIPALPEMVYFQQGVSQNALVQKSIDQQILAVKQGKDNKLVLPISFPQKNFFLYFEERPEVSEQVRTYYNLPSEVKINFVPYNEVLAKTKK